VMQKKLYPEIEIADNKDHSSPCSRTDANANVK